MASQAEGCLKTPILAEVRKGGHSSDNRSSWENDDCTPHSQIIVDRADVRVDARVRERDAKTRESQWSLRQKGFILRRRDYKTGVHTVGSRIDSRVECTILVWAHVGGWGDRVSRFRSKSNGVRHARFVICPLHRGTGMNDQFGLDEAHERDRAVPSAVGQCLSGSGDNGIRRNWLEMSLTLIEFSEQIMYLVGGLFVVERLPMRERHGRIEHMHNARHVWVHKADKLEIAGGGEHYIEGLSRDHRRSADAS